MKTVDDLKDGDFLELPGYRHLLTVTASGGDRWLALLSIFPEGWGGPDTSCLITEEDAEKLIEHLTKLIAARKSVNFVEEA